MCDGGRQEVSGPNGGPIQTVQMVIVEVSEPIRHYDPAKDEFRDVTQADWSNLYRAYGLLSVAIKEASDLSRRIALGEVEPRGQEEFYLRLAQEDREKTSWATSSAYPDGPQVR
jgi:hypothetical protein